MAVEGDQLDQYETTGRQINVKGIGRVVQNVHNLGVIALSGRRGTMVKEIAKVGDGLFLDLFGLGEGQIDAQGTQRLAKGHSDASRRGNGGTRGIKLHSEEFEFLDGFNEQSIHIEGQFVVWIELAEQNGQFHH